MEDAELIQKINKKLKENDFRIFQNRDCCTCRTGSIINLNDFTFQEIFDYVKEDCGFGNGEEEWNFIGDVKKAKELENEYVKIINRLDNIQSVSGNDKVILSINKNEHKEKRFDK